MSRCWFLLDSNWCPQVEMFAAHNKPCGPSGQCGVCFTAFLSSKFLMIYLISVSVSVEVSLMEQPFRGPASSNSLTCNGVSYPKYKWPFSRLVLFLTFPKTVFHFLSFLRETTKVPFPQMLCLKQCRKKKKAAFSSHSVSTLGQDRRIGSQLLLPEFMFEPL